MNNKTSLLAILAGIALAVAGVGTCAAIGRLSDQAVWVLVGGIGALFVVGGVGALFIVKDLAQAYVMRRMLAQDDMADLKQMAMLAKMMGNKTPNVNLRLPPGQPSGSLQPWQVVSQEPTIFDGAFRDTIVSDGVEIE